MSFSGLGFWRKFPAIYFGPGLSPIVIFSALFGLCIFSREKNVFLEIRDLEKVPGHLLLTCTIASFDFLHTLWLLHSVKEKKQGKKMSFSEVRVLEKVLENLLCIQGKDNFPSFQL
jgi:hypothetical protein